MRNYLLHLQFELLSPTDKIVTTFLCTCAVKQKPQTELLMRFTVVTLKPTFALVSFCTWSCLLVDPSCSWQSEQSSRRRQWRVHYELGLLVFRLPAPNVGTFCWGFSYEEARGASLPTFCPTQMGAQRRQTPKKTDKTTEKERSICKWSWPYHA